MKEGGGRERFRAVRLINRSFSLQRGCSISGGFEVWRLERLAGARSLLHGKRFLPNSNANPNPNPNPNGRSDDKESGKIASELCPACNVVALSLLSTSFSWFIFPSSFSANKQASISVITTGDVHYVPGLPILLDISFASIFSQPLREQNVKAVREHLQFRSVEVPEAAAADVKLVPDLVSEEHLHGGHGVHAGMLGGGVGNVPDGGV